MMAKKILVVDDVAFMRTRICKELKDNGYDQIVEAKDGVEAVTAFTANKPDLVIMDITMPNMDGLDACAAMRVIDPNVPVILSSNPEFTDKAFQAGAFDFLAKPFTTGSLLEMVDFALDDSPCIVPKTRSSEKLILTVERSASTRAVIREYVRDVGHCDIVEAKDGRTAVELFRAYKPDMVFMEIHLPGMSGLEVCREMREIDANVPVVILTKQEYINDYVNDGSVISVLDEAIRAGAKDFIMKPFEEDRFKKTVKAILG